MACYTATVQVPVPIVRVEQSNTSCLKVATFLDPPLVGKFMGTPAVPGPSQAPPTTIPTPHILFTIPTLKIHGSYPAEILGLACTRPKHARVITSQNKPEQAITRLRLSCWHVVYAT